MSIRACQLDASRLDLPEGLQVGRLVAAGSNSFLFAGCVGAAFELPATVVERLRQEGASFLETLQLLPRFEGWHMTPALPHWTSEGTWPGLACVQDRTVIEAGFYGIRSPGNYYAVSSSWGSIIIVLPEAGMVIYTYDDFSDWYFPSNLSPA